MKFEGLLYLNGLGWVLYFRPLLLKPKFFLAAQKIYIHCHELSVVPFTVAYLGVQVIFKQYVNHETRTQKDTHFDLPGRRPRR